MGFHGLLPGTASLQPLGRLPGGGEGAEVFAAFLSAYQSWGADVGQQQEAHIRRSKTHLARGKLSFSNPMGKCKYLIIGSTKLWSISRFPQGLPISLKHSLLCT